MDIRYYEPSMPGAYGGVKPLARYSNSAIKPTKNWLTSQDTYTLHKPVRKIFPRRRTFAKGKNDLFQADFAEKQNLSRYNDGYRYILTCIDVFSKRALALPNKEKRGSTIANAFEIIFCYKQTEAHLNRFKQRSTKRISEIQCTSLLESE